MKASSWAAVDPAAIQGTGHGQLREIALPDFEASRATYEATAPYAGGGAYVEINNARTDGSVTKASPPKETREFGLTGESREYVLEHAIVADFGLVRAWKGDRHGNLVYRDSARNFNPLAAMCGRVTIAEVEELVEGEATSASFRLLQGHRTVDRPERVPEREKIEAGAQVIGKRIVRAGDQIIQVTLDQAPDDLVAQPFGRGIDRKNLAGR